MKIIKVYIPTDEFSRYIASKLSREELAEVDNCTLVPLNVRLGFEPTMSIEALIVATKNEAPTNMVEPEEEYEQLRFDFGDEVQNDIV